jgi:hypothetical protein
MDSSVIIYDSNLGGHNMQKATYGYFNLKKQVDYGSVISEKS